MLSRQQAQDKLSRHGQQHVLRWFDQLDEAGQARLLAQVEALDLPWLERVQNERAAEVDLSRVRPPQRVVRPGHLRDGEAKNRGEAALGAGALGVLVVAGGQGSRLGFDGPKGAFPLGAVSGKTLFQLHAERLLAAGRRHGTVPPLYLMTSEANHAQTVALFEEHGRFGLPKERVLIFRQGQAPAVDEEGKLLLAAKDRLVMAPNGNGGLFSALRESGALDQMRALGVSTLCYVHVDNPLVPSCDARFLGHHLLAESDYSCKAMDKRHPGEKVGHFALLGGSLRVLEYFELSEALAQAMDEGGRPLYGLCNPGHFLWRRSFVEAQAARLDLPFHRAHKKIPHLDAEGRSVQPEAPNGYKFEAFAMDTLAEAERTLLVYCQRDAEFAPLKNAEGEDSPQSARDLMTRLYRGWIQAAGGRLDPPDAPVEISPLYAESAPELAARLPAGFVGHGPTYLE